MHYRILELSSGNLSWANSPKSVIADIYPNNKFIYTRDGLKMCRPGNKFSYVLGGTIMFNENCVVICDRHNMTINTSDNQPKKYYDCVICWATTKIYTREQEHSKILADGEIISRRGGRLHNHIDTGHAIVVEYAPLLAADYRPRFDVNDEGNVVIYI